MEIFTLANLIALLALMFWKLPPWLVVASGAMAGGMLQWLG